MTFDEILPALRAGKRVRREAWQHGVWIVGNTKEQSGYLYSSDILATDWTIIDDEPEYETRVRWAVRRGDEWYIGDLTWGRDRARRALFADMQMALHESGRHAASTVRPVRFRVRRKGAK